MLPKNHILLGFVFGLIVYAIFPEINLFYLALIFLSSFLIDFDHYLIVGLDRGIWGLKENSRYHKEVLLRKELAEKRKGIRRRGYFHIFHTVEFHLLVFLLGYLWEGFFYVFVGMTFHSFCDFIWLVWKDRVYRREYFFVNWIRKEYSK